MGTLNTSTTMEQPERTAEDGQQQEVRRYRLQLRRPHDKQLLFLRSRAKRKVIRAGRRGGKTTGVAILAVEQFIGNPDLGIPPRRVLYAAPTSDQLKRFWSELLIYFAGPIRAGDLLKNETDHTITMAGSEARIRAKTAWNADTLRGDYADVLILDEFQLMNEDAWGVVGAPMLLDNNGDAVFVYTPPSLHSRSTTKATDPMHARKLYKRAAANLTGKWEVFHFTSHDNPHISEVGLADITSDMTKLAYRQEIMAEDVDEVPGALWTRQMLEDTRVDRAPELKRIVVGVDPSGSTTTEVGIVAAGQGVDDEYYVIRDASMLAPSPAAWANRVVSLYYETRADRVLGERNYGGDMVEHTIRTVEGGSAISYKDANATRGKVVRAEPIAAQYEKGKVHHVGAFDLLEEEQCSYVPGAKSPNRMDALVWALIELVEGNAVLGLIEFQKAGGLAAVNALGGAPSRMPLEMAMTEKTNGASTLGKVAVNDRTEACPECDGKLIQGIPGGQHRCQACGVQWWPGGNAPATLSPQSRADYFALKRR